MTNRKYDLSQEQSILREGKSVFDDIIDAYIMDNHELRKEMIKSYRETDYINEIIGRVSVIQEWPEMKGRV